MPPPTHKVARRTSRSVPRTQPSRVIVPAKNVVAGSSISAPELSAPPASAISRDVERAALHIEIESIGGEGALAIFADQNLVFTSDLHAGAPGHPIRLERALPAGPHQLRVALYRPDKSLQTVKEGLGEIRTDTANTLRIHIGRRSKMLVRRETSLDVTWPSAIGSTPGGSAPPSFSASIK